MNLEDELRKKGIGQTVIRRTLAALGGQLQPQAAQPDIGRALERPKQARQTGSRHLGRGPVLVWVGIIRVSARELDDDNLRSAYKGFRDAIAASLGFDDGDKRIRFSYSQHVSQGRQGTIVMIERMA